MADISANGPQVGKSSAAGAGGDSTALPKEKSAKELAKEAKRLEKLEKFKAKQEKQAQQPKKAAVEVSLMKRLLQCQVIVCELLTGGRLQKMLTESLSLARTHTHTHSDTPVSGFCNFFFF